MESTGNADPAIVFAVEEAYALPLAIALRSVLDHAAPERRLRIYVVDGGLSAASRRRLAGLPDPAQAEVTFLPFDRRTVRELPLWGMHGVVYARLFLAEILPHDVTRVVYVDADTLANGDVGCLFDSELNGAPLGAVQDSSSPRIWNKDPGLLDRDTLVPNWAELGLVPEAPYFNSGVMLLDLAAWRENEFSAALVKCLRDNQRYAELWDQYALNVVFHGRWQPLDPRWNVLNPLLDDSVGTPSPIEPELWEAARDPWIIHFIGRDKPWHAASNAAGRALYRERMAHLDWPRWQRSRWTLLPPLRAAVTQRLHGAASRSRRAARRAGRRVRRGRSALRQLKKRTHIWLIERGRTLKAMLGLRRSG